MSEAPLHLDRLQRGFVTGSVAINVASRGAQGVPSIARAYGCRVSADGAEVALYLPLAFSGNVVADVRGGAPVAAVFTRPATHETLQLKGRRAELGAAGVAERKRMRAYARRFREELAAFGLDERFLSGIVAPVELEAVVLCFTPVAAFNQTPGPEAGTPLRAKG